MLSTRTKGCFAKNNQFIIQPKGLYIFLQKSDTSGFAPWRTKTYSLLKYVATFIFGKRVTLKPATPFVKNSPHNIAGGEATLGNLESVDFKSKKQKTVEKL